MPVHLQAQISIVKLLYIKKVALFILATTLFNSGNAQLKDTVKVMHYNLLYYGQTTTGCTNNNNNVNTKDGYLKTIIEHVQPDLFTVNEMGCNSVYAKRIKELVLNTTAKTYELTQLQKSGSQNICNMLFYNTKKIEVSDQEGITKTVSNSNFVRLVDYYQLKFKPKSLPTNEALIDTPKTGYLLMHLKAGNSTVDRGERGLAAEGIMTFLERNNTPGNFILAGDLNLYNHNEDAFKHFTNWKTGVFNFKDPINRIGSWHNQSSFADVHTQSTRSSGNGCASGGGMDDRFDFILASKDIIDGTKDINYLPGTYKALAQDGNRFNRSIDSPTNNSAPAKVISALYNMSDHLPVILDLEITYKTQPTGITQPKQFVQNVWVDGNRQIHVQLQQQLNPTINVIDLTGKVMPVDFQQVSNEKSISSTHLNAGIYIIQVTSPKHLKTEYFKIAIP